MELGGCNGKGKNPSALAKQEPRHAMTMSDVSDVPFMLHSSGHTHLTGRCCNKIPEFAVATANIGQPAGGNAQVGAIKFALTTSSGKLASSRGRRMPFAVANLNRNEMRPRPETPPEKLWPHCG